MLRTGSGEAPLMTAIARHVGHHTFHEKFDALKVRPGGAAAAHG